MNQKMNMGEVWQKIVKAEDARVAGSPVEKPTFSESHTGLGADVRARIEAALDKRAPTLN